LHDYVFSTIEKGKAKGAYGGYGEKRDIYQRSGHFESQDEWRSIHLGVDFWAEAGTEVRAPLPGKIHSLADNSTPGDYGPTVILEHPVGNETIFSLYGHLSRSGFKNLKEGQLIERGEVFSTLGEPFENVNWPPHLHFQLIRDIGDYRGDFPGVCFEKEKKQYLKNCPDPIKYFSEKWKEYFK
jgi:murein DD-endopeptidase MepM/ murein hydrolase activator NlpD